MIAGRETFERLSDGAGADRIQFFWGSDIFPLDLYAH
jgi:hypothetical protein